MILIVSYGGGHIAITSELYKYFTENNVNIYDSFAKYSNVLGFTSTSVYKSYLTGG